VGDFELAVRGVSKRFGRTVALDNVSFNFSRGVNLLLGANGSGKSTLINILAGLTYPDRGVLVVDDSEYSSARRGDWLAGVRSLAPSLGVLAEKPGFPLWYTGRELLHSTLRAAGLPAKSEWVEWVLDELGLTSSIDRRIREYSSGMMQKLGVAVSLAVEPRLVLWDEPTANLDAASRRIVVELMDKMRKKGTTFIVASHIPVDFEGKADWVGLLELGRVVWSGHPEAFQSPSTRVYVTCTNTHDSRELGSLILRMGLSTEVSVEGNRVLLMLGVDSLLDQSLEGVKEGVLEAARGLGVEVVDFRIAPNTISELYYNLLRINR